MKAKWWAINMWVNLYVSLWDSSLFYHYGISLWFVNLKILTFIEWKNFGGYFSIVIPLTIFYTIGVICRIYEHCLMQVLSFTERIDKAISAEVGLTSSGPVLKRVPYDRVLCSYRLMSLLTPARRENLTQWWLLVSMFLSFVCWLQHRSCHKCW